MTFTDLIMNLNKFWSDNGCIIQQGYIDCPAPGAVDLSYPTSALRRSRTVGGGVNW